MLIGDRYQPSEQIGEGAMGVVYRGVDTRSMQPIVLKKLKPDITEADMIERFRREGEALRQLNHPNIVKMLDAVEENGDHYLILEYVPGGTLRDLMDRQPKMSLDRVLTIGVELSDALSRAHHLKIVHRDLKPANILLAQDGTPRLTDFGIARIGTSALTEYGVITGTLSYIPPEAFEETEPTPLFDIWAFGVILFEMLAGQLPFPQKSMSELVNAVLHRPMQRLDDLRPDTPVPLIDLIQRMLEKDPRSRLPSVRIVGAELEAIMTASGDLVRDITHLVERTVMIDTRFTTPTPITKVRHNLPVQTTPFVGREAELAELERKVDDVPLVTILAPGGMGKTRLSLEIAAHFTGTRRENAQFPDGVFFVELAPVSDPAHIVSAIAEAVKYPFQADDRSPRQQLLDYFSEKRQLVILDNFEHVIEGAELVNAILQVAPDVHLIVTSRTRLNLAGEHIFILEPMGFPGWETPADALNYSAVKLFMQSAKRISPNFNLQTDDLAYIARICRLVEGLPLGILLAAGWLDVLSVREIADEISRSLDFLETERRDVPERQRSIRAVFDYSWALLNAAERDIFMALSVFRGGFSREAAGVVGNAELRTLQALVNKSLIRRNALSGRFEIHELLSQYGALRLEESGRANAIKTAHSHYYLSLLEKLTPALKGHGQLNALNTIEADDDNGRAAWEWAIETRDEAAIPTALEGLMLFTTFRSRIEEGKQIMQKARFVWRDDSPLAGKLRVRYPDDPPLDHYRAGLAIAEANDDQAEIAYCQRLIGHHLSHTMFDHAHGIPVLQASLALYQQIGDHFYAAQVLDDLGWSYNLTGATDHQTQAVQQSIDLRRQIGDKIGVSNALRNMGGAVGGFDGRTDQPLHYWSEAKALAAEMGDRLGVLWNAGLLATLHIVLGDFEGAHRYLDEGTPLALELSDPMLKGYMLIVQGTLVLLEENDIERAKRLLEQGFPPGTPPDFRMSLLSIAYGILGAEQGDVQAMTSIIHGVGEAFGDFLNSRIDYVISALLPIAIVFEARRGNHRRAVEILSARLQHPYGNWVQHWRLLQDLQPQMRAVLGDQAYEEAWEMGKHTNLETICREVINEIISM